MQQNNKSKVYNQRPNKNNHVRQLQKKDLKNYFFLCFDQTSLTDD